MSGGRARFQWPDYLVLVGVLVISAAIGLYQGFIGRKRATVENYLLADRKMQWLPVGISIFVTFQSAILFTGVPAETYSHGFFYVWFGVGQVGATLITTFVFVPLLFPLKLTTSYEYLERRFQSKAVRLIGSTVGTISTVIFIGLLAYASSAAMAAVSGFPVWCSILISAVLATVYTSLGGLRAVIWTDVFQCSIMLAGLVGILVQGCLEVGGVTNVWKRSEVGGRLESPSLSLDPTIRHSMWSLTIGGTFTWLANIGVHQSNVQRFSSVPDIKSARRAVLLAAPGFAVLQTVACLMGIVAYSYYDSIGCDPLASGAIQNINQVIPLFVTDVLSFVPGFPGLYIASLYCAMLSTVSSALNSLSAMVWEDLLRNRFSNLSEKNITILLKILVSIFGVIMTAVAFVMSQIRGTLAQIATAFFGATGGPLLGLYFVGALLPQVNWIGACAGAVTSLVVCFSLAFGGLAQPPVASLAPASTAGCSLSAQFDNTSATLGLLNLTLDTISSTFSNMTFDNADDNILTSLERSQPSSVLDSILRVSYLYYSLIGIGVVFIIAIPVSLVTGPTDSSTVQPELLFLVSRKICKAFARTEKPLENGNEHSVNFLTYESFPDKAKPENQTLGTSDEAESSMNTIITTF